MCVKSKLAEIKLKNIQIKVKRRSKTHKGGILQYTTKGTSEILAIHFHIAQLEATSDQ